MSKQVKIFSVVLLVCGLGLSLAPGNPIPLGKAGTVWAQDFSSPTRPRRVEPVPDPEYTASRPSAEPAAVGGLPPYSSEASDKGIAGRFAPVFHQALGDSPRFDYITKFDFDGDWKGNNNWQNAANSKYPLTANVYFSVCETQTHYFIHYAAFHPRDYKGGSLKGSILSDLLQEGAKLGGKYDPTGLSQEAVLAHENDLEGCLVVAEKRGNDPQAARLVYVETLAHNKFYQYSTGSDRSGSTIQLEGENPLLYIEPKGHGMYSLQDGKQQAKTQSHGELRYEYTGRADDPERMRGQTVGYDLIPIYTTLWAQAQGGTNDAFGLSNDYKTITVDVVKPRKIKPVEIKIGAVGNAFKGEVGGKNMARPPWGWFSSSERDRPLGEWFFDPAKAVKRHFNLSDSFSTAYVHHPILNL